MSDPGYPTPETTNLPLLQHKVYDLFTKSVEEGEITLADLQRFARQLLERPMVKLPEISEGLSAQDYIDLHAEAIEEAQNREDIIAPGTSNINFPFKNRFAKTRFDSISKYKSFDQLVEIYNQFVEILPDDFDINKLGQNIRETNLFRQLLGFIEKENLKISVYGFKSEIEFFLYAFPNLLLVEGFRSFIQQCTQEE